MEKSHLFFDLSTYVRESTFFIQGHGKIQQLTSYADAQGKWAEHQKKNAALALVSDAGQQRLTHFIEDIDLPEDRISRLSVISPAKTEGEVLPDLIAVFFHIPTRTYRRALQRLGHEKAAHPLVLRHLGVEGHHVTAANHVDIRLAARLAVLPPLANAQTMVFSHPEIGTVNTVIAANIYSQYLQNHNDFDQLVNYISSNPYSSSNPWYGKTWAIRVDPETLVESPIAPTDRKFADGKQAHWPKDPVSGKPVIPQYQLSDATTGANDGGVIGAATPAVQSVLKATKDAASLAGSIWSRGQSTVSATQSNVPPVPAAGPTRVQLARDARTRGAGDVADYWSVKYDSNRQYGLELKASDLRFKDNTVSFPVKNWPNRCLGAYVEYQLQDGTPIPWSRLAQSREGTKLVQPDGIITDAFSLVYAKRNADTTRLFFGILSSGNTVFGVPFPTNSVDIQFQWPHDLQGAAMASRAEVYVGGLGVANGFSDWDTDIDMAGLVATAILNYGITAASMAFSVAVVGPLTKKLMKSDIKYAVLAGAVNLGVVAVIVSSFFWKSGTAKMILAKISDFAAGFVFGKVSEFGLEQVYKDAIEELIEASVANLTVQEVLEEIPYAGWALKVASVASDIATLAATTIECLASPATYRMQVQETMDLTVTLRPDPRHGTEHQAPIWPLVADHWLMKLVYPKNGSYQGGTTYIKAGPMPGKHDAPITVVFEKVPAGGQIEVIAGVYSNTDWIAGQWQSGPKAATPDAMGQLALDGGITENLVPLTATTSYTEKQRVGYDADAQKHTWLVTQFAISSGFRGEFEAGQLSTDGKAAFASNGIVLPDNKSISIVTIAAGTMWDLTDTVAAVTYRCTYRQIYSSDGVKLYEIGVRNTTRPAPVLPDPKTVCDTSGANHNLCQLVDMTIDNKAYQLGYTWRASGMNLPLDHSGNPVENIQMYAMQSISTLNQPSDLIVESQVGFSQMPFIAYNQFGLTPLFAVSFAQYSAELNAAERKPVPTELAKVFTDKGFTLATGMAVQVTRAGFEWRFVDRAATVQFDLIYATDVIDGTLTPIINVFNYVIPGATSFYMDPRPDPNGNYHLRAVSFHDGTPGSYKFDVDFDPSQANSWGAFPIPSGSTLYQMAMHPGGYVVAVDYGLDKMWTLRLPDKPTTMASATLAMPMSGSGSLEGLMKQPKAMAIASDGRVILLEQGNERFQCFDTNGNPVAAFKGSLQTQFPASLAGALNSGTVTDDLSKTYQTVIPASYLRAALFAEYDNTPATDLDKGVVDATLVGWFSDHLLTLPSDAGSVQVLVNVAGSAWLVTDLTTGVVYDLRWDDAAYEFTVRYAATLQIEVVAQNVEWKVADRTNSLTFDIRSGKPAGGPLAVQQLIATAALRAQTEAAVEYLDIAVENKGYLYVLYYRNPGTNASEYMLDIYNPDGTVLLDAPLTGMAAAKMSVDQWRTLWTLNYETFLGPNNRTEPGVSGWIPSTPSGPNAAA